MGDCCRQKEPLLPLTKRVWSEQALMPAATVRLFPLQAYVASHSPITPQDDQRAF